MKKHLILMGYAFLLTGTVVATTLASAAESYTDIVMRAGKLTREAEARAMEQCSTSRIVVQVPHMDFGTNIVKTVDRTVSIQWTGSCVNGKREGEGVLTWSQELDYGDSRDVVTNIAEGRFVKGQRLGLWCETMKWGKGEISGCHVLGGHTKLLTKLYNKQPDGSWLLYTDSLTGIGATRTGMSLAPGTLEAQGTRVLADAAAGKKDLKVEVAGQSKSLNDLVRGSKIALAPSFEPIPLKNQRVAVVLSSNMIKEMERFKRERQALITSSAGLTGTAAQYRAQFIAASNPDRLLTNIAKTLGKHAKSVQAADDLVGLKQGAYDYALIVDWKHITRFDLLGKFGKFPADNFGQPMPAGSPLSYAGESLEIFLVNRELKAIKHSPGVDWGKGRPAEDTDDQAYMSGLAYFFEHKWGKGPDDVGSLMRGLDFLLSH